MIQYIGPVLSIAYASMGQSAPLAWPRPLSLGPRLAQRYAWRANVGRARSCRKSKPPVRRTPIAMASVRLRGVKNTLFVSKKSRVDRHIVTKRRYDGKTSFGNRNQFQAVTMRSYRRTSKRNCDDF